MLFTLTLQLWTCAVVQALTETPPLPPQEVYAEDWQLEWSNDTDDSSVTYTVQYSAQLGITEPKWKDVPSCVQTPLNSCNVTFTKGEEKKFHCVMLRVQAQRLGLKSAHVNACSTHGDLCTPNVSLSAHPESLTVHLIKDHPLFIKEAAQVKQTIYFWKEGEEPEVYDEVLSSMTINDLEVGQRYCVSVQYLYYGYPIGMRSCPQCEEIPPTRSTLESHLKEAIIVPVVISTIIAVVILSYVLIFKRENLKQYLQPPYEIPSDFLLDDVPTPPNTCSPREEICSTISCMTPLEVRGQRRL